MYALLGFIVYNIDVWDPREVRVECQSQVFCCCCGRNGIAVYDDGLCCVVPKITDLLTLSTGAWREWCYCGFAEIDGQEIVLTPRLESGVWTCARVSFSIRAAVV